MFSRINGSIEKKKNQKWKYLRIFSHNFAYLNGSFFSEIRIHDQIYHRLPNRDEIRKINLTNYPAINGRKSL